jgi:acylglycerol lipase
MPIESRSSMFETFDGLGLYEQWWKWAGSTKAGIVIIHGLGEHSGRYHKVAMNLVEDGFNVYMFDLRGHGKSDGVLAAVDTFDDYLDDLAVCLKRIRRKQEEPLFLMGLSMGGLIAALYTATHEPALRGIILISPAVRLGGHVSPFWKRLIQLIGRVFPGMPTVSIEPEWLSRDEQVVDDYQNDPLVYHGKIPAVTGLAMLRAGKLLREQMDRIQVPALILHGEMDRLTSPEASRELVDGIGSNDKTLKMFENMEHDLLHEPEKQQVMKEIREWINNRIRSESFST